MYIIPIHNQAVVTKFIKDNDTTNKITSFDHLWRDTFGWNKYLVGWYNGSHALRGIMGFGINDYGNIEPSFTLVAKKARRQGIAKDLKLWQETTGIVLKAQRIYTIVRQDNDASIRLLESLGYFPYRKGLEIYYFVKQIGTDTSKLPRRIEL